MRTARSLVSWRGTPSPDLHAVTVHRRTANGAFPAAAHVTAEWRDTLETPLVPEWSVTLARVFR